MTNWFQTNECFDFYSSLSFLEPFKYEVKRNGEVKGRIVGYIQKDGGKLKKYFSRRAIINGGPFLADDIYASEVSELLKRCRTGLTGKAIYIEIRCYNDYSSFKKIFSKAHFAYEPHLDFIVDTKDKKTDDILKILDKSRRKKINKAIKGGAIISTHPTEEDIRDFFSILSELYANKVKTPLFPFEFFEKLWKSDFGQINVIKIGNQVIAGQVCICGLGNTVYEMFMAGKDVEYKEYSPSSLATYSGILYAAINGFEKCDMMGAGKPHEKYGVRDFKSSFGGKLVEYGRFKCILNKPLYQIGKIGISLMKKIK